MKEKRNRKGKSMKKILLVAINAKYIHSNLAVYSLKAAAGKYGDQIEIAEYTINQQLDQILGDIYRRKPDVAAFSCYIWNGKQRSGQVALRCPMMQKSFSKNIRKYGES